LRENLGNHGPIVRMFYTLLDRLLEECTAFYGNNLTSLVVFGSVGRGTPTYYSDIDLLIIAKELPFGRIPRARQFDEVEKKLLRDFEQARIQGVHTRLSPIFRTEREMELGGLIFLDMVYDSKVLFDRSDFFKNYIGKLKEKLNSMKALRINRGDTWYWVLKPDLKPGEVIDV